MSHSSARLSRRVFVRALGPAALLPWIACELDPATGAPDAAPDANDASRPEAPAAACPPFLTPTADFFQQFGGSRTIDGWQMPELDADFALRIEGLASEPFELTLAMLEADVASHARVLKTMMCVLGSRGTALFTGVPLRGLLDRAGIMRQDAKRVRFFGADGFENNLKLGDIYDPPGDLFEPLIAFRINDAPLPPALGYPFRLLLNDRFGFKNTKWLARIEVSAEDLETGQYQERGYPDAGVIAPVPTTENTRVNQEVEAGPLALCGFALSGRAGIARVELALDGAAYEPAELSGLDALTGAYPEIETSAQLQDPARYGFPPAGVWAQWQKTLELGQGMHEVAVRVVDRAGETGDGATLTLRAGS